MLIEYVAWGTAFMVGCLAGIMWMAAYRLHMENDRADGPCGVHRFLKRFSQK